METITGTDLRAFRAYLNKTQADFGLEIGYSPKMVFNFETNRLPIPKASQLGIYFLMQKYGFTPIREVAK